jgi:hypothetical protein
LIFEERRKCKEVKRMSEESDKELKRDLIKYQEWRRENRTEIIEDPMSYRLRK